MLNICFRKNKSIRLIIGLELICIYFKFVDFTLLYFISRMTFKRKGTVVGLETSHLLNFSTLGGTEQEKKT